MKELDRIEIEKSGIGVLEFKPYSIMDADGYDIHFGDYPPILPHEKEYNVTLYPMRPEDKAVLAGVRLEGGAVFFYSENRKFFVAKISFFEFLKPNRFRLKIEEDGWSYLTRF